MYDNFLIAVSLANLLLIWEWLNAFYPEHHSFNIHSVPTDGILGFALAGLLYFIFTFFLLKLAEDKKFATRSKLLYLVLFSLAMVPIIHFRNFSGWGYKYPGIFSPMQFAGDWGKANIVKILFILGALCLLYWKFFRSIRIVLRTSLLFLFPFAILTWGKLLWEHQTHHSDKLNRLSQTSSGPNVKAKTIWILYDALDYNYLFNIKETQKTFPEFERFRQSSFSFSHAIAPTPRTTYSMTSYFYNQTATDLNFIPLEASSGKFLELGDDKIDLKKLPHLYQKAKNLGATTGIIGWHLPYCDFFKESLDFCIWFSPIQWPYADTVGSNLVATLSHTFFRKTRLKSLRRNIQENTLKNILDLINDNLPDLTLVHFPVPHFPGISREDHTVYKSVDEQTVADYYNNVSIDRKSVV